MRRLYAFFSAIVFAFPSMAAMEFKEGTILRDAEIESILQRYIDPLFRAAGLNPKDAKLYLIASSDINAAATFNKTIMVNTGFLTSTKNPEEVLGVLAHETGHIADGHVILGIKAQDAASLASIIGLLAGVIAGAATGNAGAGTAIAMGGAQVGAMSYLHFSRGQEAAADQAAVRLLNKMHVSAGGLVSFLDKLSEKELLASTFQDPYMLTHPLSQERVDLLHRNADKSPYKNSTLPAQDQKLFALMQAKINAYMDPPGRTLQNVSPSDTAELPRYARAIAHFRNGDMNEANTLIKGLIAQSPSNPYFHEVGAQIAESNGDLVGAKEAYQKAVHLLPGNTLMNTLYAQSLVNLEKADAGRQAKTILLQAVDKEKDSALAWRLLSIIYGRENNMGQMALCLSEMHFINGDMKQSLDQAKRALHFAGKDSQVKQRAGDLIDAAKRLLDNPSPF